MKIIVQNRQRQKKIDGAQLKTMVYELSLSVFDNLKEHKPEWRNNLETIGKQSLLTLMIVSPKTIRKLNKQWLANDKETDVLSFPLIDLPNFGNNNELIKLSHIFELPPHNNDRRAKINKEEDYFELGEIFISYQQAIKQAKEYGHSLDRELAFLFVHGLLHIFGFDHQTKAEEKVMFALQKKILVKAGYVRR